MACKKIRRVKRDVCIGSLDRVIKVEFRSIESPDSGVDFNEQFTPIQDVPAMIKTVSGVTGFDSTNVERIITHHIYIRFRTDVTAETWVEFNNEKYDIVNTENIDERSEFFLLRCNKRGSNTKPVNFI